MITIMLLTFDRLELAKRTMMSVRKNLVGEDTWIHVADDGSSQEYRDELLALAHELWGDRVSVTNSERTGYGGNYNAATQVVHALESDLVLPLEDDWELVREFDVTPIARVLREGTFNCVRMGYIGYTKELRCTWRWTEGDRLQWLELDPASDERHIFAGGPRLETVSFERSIGPWPINEQQGKTEMEVCDRPESRVKVAWPVSLIKPAGDAFVHIGTLKAGEDSAGSMSQMQAVRS